MSFVSIKAAIKTKLQGISDIKEVYDYPIKPLEFVFNSFPVAVIVESGNEADYLSTKENMRVYAFEIVIFQEVEAAGGVKEAYDKLDAIADTVIDALDNDQSLGSVSDFNEPSFAGFQDFARREKTMLVATIILKVHKIKLLT